MMLCDRIIYCYACDVTYIQSYELSAHICVCARFVLFIHIILSFFLCYSKKMVILLCISACFIRYPNFISLYLGIYSNLRICIYVFKKETTKIFAVIGKYIVSIVFGADVFKQASRYQFWISAISLHKFW